MKSKNVNSFIWFLSILLISVSLLYLVFSKKIIYFIHPRMIKFQIISIIILILLTIIQFYIFITSKSKEKFKPALLLFLLPFILGMNISTNNISSNISKNKSINLSETSPSPSVNSDDFSKIDVLNVNNENYYRLMDSISKNVNAYKGKKIVTEGFVFRDNSFNENEFVAARMMIVCCAADAQVVGFMCKWDNAKTLKSHDWVKVVGTIDSFDYSQKSSGSIETIPIINIDSVEVTIPPKDQYIYPK